MKVARKLKQDILVALSECALALHWYEEALVYSQEAVSHIESDPESHFLFAKSLLGLVTLPLQPVHQYDKQSEKQKEHRQNLLLALASLD